MNGTLGCQMLPNFVAGELGRYSTPFEGRKTGVYSPVSFDAASRQV